MPGRLPVVLVLVLPMACLAQATPLPPSVPAMPLDACRDAAAAAVPAPARDALPAIDGSGRQLLALRGYLRARDLEQRWSWSDARIEAYAGSPEQAAAHAAIGKVQDAFAQSNPGYRLHVNLQVRSLDEQLRKWNGNASVAAAAAALATAAEDACDPQEPDRFVAWLKAWRPPAAVNLATPGLSSHGQARAFDFQVMQDDTLVAGTDSGRRQQDWIDGGWGERLAAAVRASGEPFEGPLRSPDEPWHYAYAPSTEPESPPPASPQAPAVGDGT